MGAAAGAPPAASAARTAVHGACRIRGGPLAGSDAGAGPGPDAAGSAGSATAPSGVRAPARAASAASAASTTARTLAGSPAATTAATREGGRGQRGTAETSYLSPHARAPSLPGAGVTTQRPASSRKSPSTWTNASSRPPRGAARGVTRSRASASMRHHRHWETARCRTATEPGGAPPGTTSHASRLGMNEGSAA